MIFILRFNFSTYFFIAHTYYERRILVFIFSYFFDQFFILSEIFFNFRFDFM